MADYNVQKTIHPALSFKRNLLNLLTGSTLLFIASMSVGLAGTNEMLLAKKCFVEKNNFEYKQMAYSADKELVLFSVEQKYWWEQLLQIKAQKQYTKDCGQFVNVSDDWEDYATQSNVSYAVSSDYEAFLYKYLEQVDKDIADKKVFSETTLLTNVEDPNKTEARVKLFNSVQRERIQTSLDLFTANFNRGANTSYGVEAADQVKNWMDELARTYNKPEEDFTVYYIPTTSRGYLQPSVVAVLGKNLPGEPIVISAHMDTLGGRRMPGADDDGSGSMVVLETARVLLGSDQKFNRPVYFIWYAAEEVGLVGSKQVVRTMKTKKMKFDSVLHFDTVGRRANPEDSTMWFLSDYVDANFTDYVANLAKNHLDVQVAYTKCGYACSDHASWTQGGFVAAAPAESAFDDINPYLHTDQDTVEKLSFDNLVNLTKLALAYVVDKAVEV